MAKYTNRVQGLYEGEVFDDVAGHPCIWSYKPATHKDKPLAVFVPGGMHLARIAYGGHTGYYRDDFLATALNDLGFGFLGISYTLESDPQIMPPVSPTFDIASWGSQAAQVTKRVVDTYELNSSVILISWSMGGRILVPYCRAVRSLGLEVKLYVPLAAASGIMQIHSHSIRFHPTTTGYALMEGATTIFHDQIREQEKHQGDRVIIPEDVFVREYYGATPIGITGSGLQLDTMNSFIDDHGRGVTQSSATAFSDLPWISPIYPSSQLDAFHALSDQSTWGFMLVQMLSIKIGKRLNSRFDEDHWQRIVSLVRSAPQNLSACVKGNHFFFLGSEGALQTALLVMKQLETSERLQHDLDVLLDQCEE